MASLAFLFLLLGSIGGEARSLKNSLHGQQVAQDYAAQALRLQDLALLLSPVATNVTLLSSSAALSQSQTPTTATPSLPSTVTSSGATTPTTSQAVTGIANSNSTVVVGFSVYSASNLPTGVFAPPSSCANAMMAAIECNSTILLMGYDFYYTTTIVHDNQSSTESTHLLTLPVSRQCVPPPARHPSSPTGLMSYLIVLATQCRLPITEPILVCMPSSYPAQSTQIA